MVAEEDFATEKKIMLPLNLSLCFHIYMSIVVNRVKLNDLVKVTQVMNC